MGARAVTSQASWSGASTEPSCCSHPRLCSTRSAACLASASAPPPARLRASAACTAAEHAAQRWEPGTPVHQVRGGPCLLPRLHLDGGVWHAAQARPPLVRCQGKGEAQLAALHARQAGRRRRLQQRRGVAKAVRVVGRGRAGRALLLGCSGAGIHRCRQLWQGAEERHRLRPLPHSGNQQAAGPQHAAEGCKRRRNVGHKPAGVGQGSARALLAVRRRMAAQLRDAAALACPRVQPRPPCSLEPHAARDGVKAAGRKLRQPLRVCLLADDVGEAPARRPLPRQRNKLLRDIRGHHRGLRSGAVGRRGGAAVWGGVGQR